MSTGDGCDAVEHQCAQFILDTLLNRQPMQDVRYCGWDAVELPLTDDQSRCSVKNPLKLPHEDAIHSSNDSVTIVYTTDNQSVDPRQLHCQASMFFWSNVVASDRLRRWWEQRPLPVIRLTWWANVSCWSMVTLRQVTVRRSTAEPLTTRTDMSILASRCCVPQDK